ncbi:MAG TPA: FAD-dependent oxidoreductase [Gemmatimonadales bacterium]|nr:FAD-dependent oxidoreductase [Gemmatimonadales bacterium]
MHVVVIGAGAFGGWTALHLRRNGARVTLLDAWGPGNSRASSGGETRVIRLIYGGQRRYVELTIRAFELWWQHEERWRHRLYQRTGALWLFGENCPDGDAYARNALPLIDDPDFRIAKIPLEQLRASYPAISTHGLRSAFFEHEAGYLLARDACAAVCEGFVAEGGEYRREAARPGRIAGGAMHAVMLGGGATLRADAFVFACGPWLGRLFPEVIGDRIRPTRQEVLFFGTPPGAAAYDESSLPVWLEHGERFVYGIPGDGRRGFKLADDTRGGPIDPTSDDRVVSPEAVARARAFLARRFPALAAAPLVESRVCQYEQTPDGDFILDRHPAAHNVWLAGGGSGHGFKMGPAVGELVARMVLGRAEPEAEFVLRRLVPGQTVRTGAATGPSSPSRLAAETSRP